MNFHASMKVGTTLYPQTRILSVGDYLPKNTVKSDHLLEEIGTEAKYGIPTNWLSECMGIKERRFSKQGVLPSNLAIRAGREAIDSYNNINIDEIDLIMFCGIEKDQTEPATAHTVQSSLGLKCKYTFDISNACYGFNDGVEIANAYIASGMARYALITTGEVFSKVIPSFMRQLKKGQNLTRAQNLIGWMSLGDAGGAMLIGPSKLGDPRGFMAFHKNIDSLMKTGFKLEIQ